MPYRRECARPLLRRQTCLSALGQAANDRRQIVAALPFCNCARAITSRPATRSCIRRRVMTTLGRADGVGLRCTRVSPPRAE